MKTRRIAEIGTHPSCQIVLWNNKPIKQGDRIYAMKADLYDSLHSSWRKLKRCGYWKEYYVDEDLGFILRLCL